MRRMMIAGFVLLAVASAVPGRAYVAREHNERWAEVGFYEDPAAKGAWLQIMFEGKTSYGGAPPAEIGGAGGAELCIRIEYYGIERVVRPTCTDSGFELTSLESARAEGSMEVEVIDSETGEAVGTETLTFDVTFIGNGPSYPGAGAQTDPEPAVALTVTLLRDAIVEGSIVSPSLGTFDLAGRRARLGQSQTVELAPLAEAG